MSTPITAPMVGKILDIPVSVGAQVEGQKYNRKSYLLMHAMGANTGGQVGSIMAAAIMLSVVRGLGIS